MSSKGGSEGQLRESLELGAMGYGAAVPGLTRADVVSFHQTIGGTTNEKSGKGGHQLQKSVLKELEAKKLPTKGAIFALLAKPKK